MSTASCSSPKEFTHEVAVHEAVRTCDAVQIIDDQTIYYAISATTLDNVDTIHNSVPNLNL